MIHDISLPVDESTPVWPGDPPLAMRKIASLDAGDEANVTHVRMCAHTGTHVDAPAHYLRDGATVDEIDLDVLIGPAWVADARRAHTLNAAILEGMQIPRDTERLLLRTRNSDEWARGATEFDSGFVALTTDGARWIVERRMRLIGVDGLSVAAWDQTGPTHVILLGSGVIPLEGLNLDGIRPGPYQLVCLPLRLVGADGAPARAVLIESG